jgi:hypothetical protein
VSGSDRWRGPTLLERLENGKTIEHCDVMPVNSGNSPEQQHNVLMGAFIARDTIVTASQQRSALSLRMVKTAVVYIIDGSRSASCRGRLEHSRPDRVALAYTEDRRWRNRGSSQLDYRLIKERWAIKDNRGHTDWLRDYTGALDTISANGKSA